jgi:hypothetical protein
VPNCGVDFGLDRLGRDAGINLAELVGQCHEGLAQPVDAFLERIVHERRHRLAILGDHD